MNYSAYNLERTRAPRRRTPWWVYALAAVLIGFMIWGIITIISNRKSGKNSSRETPSEAIEQPVVEAPKPTPVAPATPPPVIRPTPTPTPVPQPPPQTRVPATEEKPAQASAPPITTAPVNSSGPVSGDLQKAVDAKSRDDFVAARAAALAVWNSTANQAEKQRAEEILNEVGIGLVLSGREMPEKVEYTVMPGDSLEKIAKKFSTTIELIKAGNNIRGHIIKAGDRLRILNGTFSVKVSKSRNDLELYLNDQFFKRYRVGTGEYNKTPVGDFVINDRIAQPTWWRPDGKAIPFGDPENLLGTHWLSINVKGYGLHGTWEPDTIGKQASAGCVRMYNEDIEQLFSLLPLGTSVSIRD